MRFGTLAAACGRDRLDRAITSVAASPAIGCIRPRGCFHRRDGRSRHERVTTSRSLEAAYGGVEVTAVYDAGDVPPRSGRVWIDVTERAVNDSPVAGAQAQIGVSANERFCSGAERFGVGETLQCGGHQTTVAGLDFLEVTQSAWTDLDVHHSRPIR